MYLCILSYTRVVSYYWYIQNISVTLKFQVEIHINRLYLEHRHLCVSDFLIISNLPLRVARQTLQTIVIIFLLILLCMYNKLYK